MNECTYRFMYMVEDRGQGEYVGPVKLFANVTDAQSFIDENKAKYGNRYFIKEYAVEGITQND